MPSQVRCLGWVPGGSRCLLRRYDWIPTNTRQERDWSLLFGARSDGDRRPDRYRVRSRSSRSADRRSDGRWADRADLYHLAAKEGATGLRGLCIGRT